MKQRAVIPAGNEWIEKDIREFSGSPAVRIGDEWMLITAGTVDADKGNWNTMTASWGGLGVLWGRNVAFMFIRNTRLSFEFANAGSLFSLSFFAPSFHKALEIAGVKSGRDIDKAKEAGLTPIEFTDGSIGFKEAGEIISCRKLYAHDFDPAQFLDPRIDSEIYPKKDYHRMYIGEITALRVKG